MVNGKVPGHFDYSIVAIMRGQNGEAGTGVNLLTEKSMVDGFFICFRQIQEKEAVTSKVSIKEKE